MAVKDAFAVLPCWTTDFMDRKACGASSWAAAPRRPAATVSAGAVVSAPAAVYCCCCQANRNDWAVGSAESSEPNPVARPMTRTPMATIATAAMRERFARRAAGEALRPGLPELGATWRAGRLPPGTGRVALVPRERRVPGAEGAEWVGGAKGLEGTAVAGGPEGIEVAGRVEGAGGVEGAGAFEGVEGTAPFGTAGPGPRPSGASGWVSGAKTPPGQGALASGAGGLPWGSRTVVSGPGAAASGPGAAALGAGASVAGSGPLSRGLGAKRPRGLAWPPRSLAGGDTILLPVTVAVSRLGPLPWPLRAWPGPGVCRRSACRGRAPAPP